MYKLTAVAFMLRALEGNVATTSGWKATTKTG
jgi:hypothetical protein